MENIIPIIIRDAVVYVPVITLIWSVAKLYNQVQTHEKEIAKLKTDEINDIDEIKLEIKLLDEKIDKILDAQNQQRIEVAIIRKELELQKDKSND